MEVSRGIWDTAQTLIQHTGETTTHKLYDKMDEKKKMQSQSSLFKATYIYARLKSFLGRILNSFR